MFGQSGLGRLLNLDLPAPDLAEFDANSFASCVELTRGILQRLYSGEWSAAHWFYHEANDVVRVCVWSPAHGCWYETLPLTAEAGLRLVGALRRAARRRGPQGNWVRGVLVCRAGGRALALAFDSPHAWEARVRTTPTPPPYLPYELVHAESWRSGAKA